jgi:hypothetical protein
VGKLSIACTKPMRRKELLTQPLVSVVSYSKALIPEFESEGKLNHGW